MVLRGIFQGVCCYASLSRITYRGNVCLMIFYQSNTFGNIRGGGGNIDPLSRSRNSGGLVDLGLNNYFCPKAFTF